MGELARELEDDTLTRLRRVLGDNHPRTLRSAAGLATDLRLLGEYNRAYALDADTLHRRRDLFGDLHPSALESVRDLAADLRALGQPERAQRWDDYITEARRRLDIGHV